MWRVDWTCDKHRAEHAVSLDGEIDLATVDALAAAVEALARCRHADVTVALQEVTFMDSTGLTAMAAFGGIARSRGGAVRARGARPAVKRVFEITQLSVLLDDPEPAI